MPMSTPELKLQPPSTMTEAELTELFYKVVAEIEEDKKHPKNHLTQKEKEEIDAEIDELFAPLDKQMKVSINVMGGLVNAFKQ